MDAASRLRSLFSKMSRDRSSRLFFLLNPKQIAATEAKALMEEEEEEARLVTFPFEAGFLPSMSFHGMDEGEVTAKLRVLSSPSSKILESYMVSILSFREALATLTGRKVSLSDSVRVISRTIKQNKAVFRHKETGKFCVDCGRYLVSPYEMKLTLPCNKKHRFIDSSVFKIDDVVILAWEEGIVLEGYMSRLLESDGWNTVLGGEVVGKYGSRHEIDVLAEKDDNYLIVECKHLAPYNNVPYDDVMLSFGKMTIVEETIKAMYRQKRKMKIGKVIKAFVTTGKLAKTKKVRSMIIEAPEFMVAETDDLVRGLTDFRKRMGKITTA